MITMAHKLYNPSQKIGIGNTGLNRCSIFAASKANTSGGSGSIGSYESSLRFNRKIAETELPPFLLEMIDKGASITIDNDHCPDYQVSVKDAINIMKEFSPNMRIHLKKKRGGYGFPTTFEYFVTEKTKENRPIEIIFSLTEYTPRKNKSIENFSVSIESGNEYSIIKVERNKDTYKIK